MSWFDVHDLCCLCTGHTVSMPALKKVYSQDWQPVLGFRRIGQAACAHRRPASSEEADYAGTASDEADCAGTDCADADCAGTGTGCAAPACPFAGRFGGVASDGFGPGGSVGDSRCAGCSIAAACCCPQGWALSQSQSSVSEMCNCPADCEDRPQG